MPRLTVRHASVLLSLLFLVAALPCKNARADEPQKIRILLVGDSTVTDAAGWGGAIGDYFQGNVEIINRAKGGASSMSFFKAGIFQKAIKNKPDFVLIQFGHNDCPGKGPKRETDPQTTFKEYMTKYIDGAKAAGAKPILVTSVTRRQLSNERTIKTTLTPFVEAVKELGKATKTPVLDLNAASVKLFTELGDEKCDELQPEGDHTHFNQKGAKVVAGLVAKELAKSDSALSQHLKPQAATSKK